MITYQSTIQLSQRITMYNYVTVRRQKMKIEHILLSNRIFNKTPLIAKSKTIYKRNKMDLKDAN